MEDLMAAQDVLRIVLVESPATSDAIREACKTSSDKAHQEKRDSPLGNCLIAGQIES